MSSLLPLSLSFSLTRFINLGSEWISPWSHGRKEYQIGLVRNWIMGTCLRLLQSFPRQRIVKTLVRVLLIVTDSDSSDHIAGNLLAININDASNFIL
jgi:hypothetical protein